MVVDRGSSNDEKSVAGRRLHYQSINSGAGGSSFQNRLGINSNRGTGRFSRGPLSLPSAVTDNVEYRENRPDSRHHRRISSLPEVGNSMNIPLLAVDGNQRESLLSPSASDDSEKDSLLSSSVLEDHLPFTTRMYNRFFGVKQPLGRSILFHGRSDVFSSETPQLDNRRYRDPSAYHHLTDRDGNPSDHHSSHSQTQSLLPPPALQTTTDPVGPYPPNVVRNQKYSVLSFIPLFLYNEFRFFFNLYFLIVALTQMFPVLQVGFLFTYVAPLVMVLLVSMIKEILDDVHRARRDAAANSEQFSLLRPDGSEQRVRSQDLRVGDVLVLRQDQRVPCDCVLLRTGDAQGTVFIRTDQLDGETDWKLRRAIPLTQNLPSDEAIFEIDARLEAEAPRKEIYQFLGTFTGLGGAILSPLHSSSSFTSSLPTADTNEATELTNEGTDIAVSVSEKEPRESHRIDSLSLENTLWGNTVLATGIAVAVVVYTGAETRSVLNTSVPSSKVGLVDEEINFLAKALFILTLGMATMMTVFNGTHAGWAVYLFRMVLLFSSIIPVSLRVNLDMGKMVYARLIEKDDAISGTIVRTTNISEELGRVEYVFTDKTGTLTRNEMVFKTLQLSPPVAFNAEHTALIKYSLRQAFLTAAAKEAGSLMGTIGNPMSNVSSNVSGTTPTSPVSSLPTGSPGSSLFTPFSKESRSTSLALSDSSTSPSSPSQEAFLALPEKDQELLRTFEGQGAGGAYVDSLTREALTAIALCHNVTPVYKEAERERDSDVSLSSLSDSVDEEVRAKSLAEARADAVYLEEYGIPRREFQAASPDEVALVSFADIMGLHLTARTTTSMELTTPLGIVEKYEVLQTFPFTSESKRMGIVVRSESTGKITFFVKGAESVMLCKVLPAAWLEEEVANLARVGLRTLVFAKKSLTQEEYNTFDRSLRAARSLLGGRDAALTAAIEAAESRMTLIGLTGVEDRLQDSVRSSLETLRNAGVAVWMLTGDKAETAACIATSAKLIDRGQTLFPLVCENRAQAAETLGRLADQPPGTSLLVEGSALKVLMDNFPSEFAELACRAPAVVCSRCSPTQKAEVVELARRHTGKRTLAIGDGGNDVAMIQAADVGIGIVGKEGRQAANAADFSITQFSFLVRLMLWHGRNSYKRSAGLALFIMHRGLIISVMQCVFSALFFFVAVPIYTGWLTVGYTTVFTMLPVFAQVLDEDVSEATVALFPEIYSEAQRARFLSFKAFLLWLFLSVYQGGLIIVLAMVLFEDSFVNIVGITFTALIVCELVNIGLTVVRWRAPMIWSQIVSVIAYLVAMFTLRSYFDITFIFSRSFAWKVAVITSAVTLPPALVRWVYYKINPPVHAKIDNHHS